MTASLLTTLTTAGAAADIALWVFAAGLASLALGLAGTFAAAGMKRAHPVQRSLILTVFLAAGSGTLVAGFPLTVVSNFFQPTASASADALSAESLAGMPFVVSVTNSDFAGNPDKSQNVAKTAGSGQVIPPLPASSRSLFIGLGVVWLAGTGVLLFLPLTSLRRLQKWKDGAVAGEGFDGFPTLHSSCPQPMCAGLFRPVILLPAWWASLPTAARTAVLRHEAAHIRHGDLWIMHLQWIAVSLHWWNPFVRVLSRRLSGALEERADLAVLRGGIPATDYAQCLLDCAARLIMPQRASLGLAVASSVETVRRRIVTLLSETRPASPGRMCRAASLLAAGTVCVSIPAVIPSVAFAQEPAKPASTDPGRSVTPANADPDPDKSQTQSTAQPDSRIYLSSDQPTAMPAEPPATSPSANPASAKTNQRSSTAGTPDRAIQSVPINNNDPLRRILEIGGKAFRKPSPKAGKSGASPLLKVEVEQIIMGPNNSMTLKGSVRISFEGGQLEAETVVLQDPRQEAPTARDTTPLISVTGKYRFKHGSIICFGQQETSSLEMSPNGGFTAINSILRTEGTSSAPKAGAH